MSKLDDLEKAEQAATPGPWQEFAESGDWWIEQSDGAYNGTGVLVGGSPNWEQRDLDLALAARNALPALLRVVRAARAVGITQDEDGEFSYYPGALQDLAAALAALEEIREGK